MKRNIIPVFLLFSALNPVWAGNQPANPPPAVDQSLPTTPEGRRAYKIGVLEANIAEDKQTIANPGGGKQAEVAERVKVAKHNLKIDQDVLAKIKAGADMEVYFCSMCGREYMKEGTCPHCKLPLKPMFVPGTKRPPLQPAS